MGHTDEIAILEVETVQFVAGLFCIHNIFVNNERGAFGVVGYALPYLPVACLSYCAMKCSSCV